MPKGSKVSHDAEPAVGAFAITPNDSTVFSRIPRAIYIGNSGSLKVDMESGDTVTFANVPVGVLPITVTRVYATGTTASNLIGLC